MKRYIWTSWSFPHAVPAVHHLPPPVLPSNEQYPNTTIESRPIVLSPPKPVYLIRHGQSRCCQPIAKETITFLHDCRLSQLGTMQAGSVTGTYGRHRVQCRGSRMVQSANLPALEPANAVPIHCLLLPDGTLQLGSGSERMSVAANGRDTGVLTTVVSL